MTVFLVICFLFFVGSCIGWCTEVLFRRFFTAKKWINPGFLTGPYLPLYGFGLVGLFLICLIPVHTGYAWADAVIIIAIMGFIMTLIEYIAGLVFIKGMNIKLWDYTDRRGNIQGIICPLFSLLWTIVGALYYFVVDPFVIDWVKWFVSHISFAFFVGIFFGVFIIDFAHSVNLSVRIRKFAKKHDVVVKFEKLKETVRDRIERRRAEKKSAEGAARPNFLFPFKSSNTFEKSLDDYLEDEGARPAGDGGDE